MDAYVFTLDLVPRKSPTPVIHVSQYDVGRPFLAHIQNDGVDFTIPSGAVVRVNGKKPDNNIFSYTASFTGSDIYFETEEQMTPLAGDVNMEIAIASGDLSIGSMNFKMLVEQSPIEGGVDSETAIDWVQQAQAAANTAVQAAESINLATFLQNNGTTTEAGHALDARYGKTLADQVAALNSSQFRLVGGISADKDLNDYHDHGVYFYNNPPINAPSSNPYALMLVFGKLSGTNYYVIQVVCTSGYHYYVRRHFGDANSNWGAWREINVSEI